MKLAGTVGLVVGVLGFAFGVFQYVEGAAVQRGEYQAMVKQLSQQVSRLEHLLDEQEQLGRDLRARVVELERVTRWIHGDPQPPR